MNWLLPEYISDALPQESAGIESRRRAILDLFRTCGYELIIPPLIEYLDSLLTGTGRDLDLRTFKLTDQLSGKTLGLRADITPQAARIDAHLLNREGVVRLCYCDSTLHTLPTVTGNREPLQIGAEIYGYSGLEADRETIRLMAQSLETAGLPAERIDISHVGIFRALARSAALSPTAENELLGLLQSKDSAGLKTFTATLSEPLRTVFQAMPALYGGVEILAQAARVLPDTPEIRQALTDLRCLAETLADLPLSFDLADLRGYHYHNGVVFAAYSGAAAGAIALGGRYDGAGQAFGRARPATGFSFDLREVVRLSPLLPAASGIVAPYAGTDAQLAACIRGLRQRGEIVIESLPGDIPVSGPSCDRQLVYKNGQWEIEALPAQIV